MALFEYYQTGGDDSRKVTGNYWAQTFTPQQAHKIEYVKVYLMRIFFPGTLELRIHNTDGVGKPTSVIAYGSIPANDLPTSYTWIQINLNGGGVNLEKDVQYAMSLHCTDGSDTHYMSWRDDSSSPGYAGGKDWNGGDGVNWSSWFGCDFYFQEYGTLTEIGLAGSSAGISGTSGSLTVAKKLSGIITGTSNAYCNLTKAAKELKGVITAISSVSDTKLSGDFTIKLNGEVISLSEIIASLDSQPGCKGNIVVDSNIAAFLGFWISLAGQIEIESTVNGEMDAQQSFNGSINSESNVSGFLSVEKKLVGSSEEQLEIGGKLTTVYLSVLKTLSGSVSEVSYLDGWLVPYFDGRRTIRPSSNVSGSIQLLMELYGSANCALNIEGSLSVLTRLAGATFGVSETAANMSYYLRLLGIYERMACTITAYVNQLAKINGYVFRYENDPRETPESNLWHKCRLDFENSNPRHIGVKDFRHAGNLTIEMYGALNRGTSELLRTIDNIIGNFTDLTVNDLVKFKTPSVRNRGRIGENYQMDIVCPFVCDAA